MCIFIFMSQCWSFFCSASPVDFFPHFYFDKTPKPLVFAIDERWGFTASEAHAWLFLSVSEKRQLVDLLSVWLQNLRCQSHVWLSEWPSPHLFMTLVIMTLVVNRTWQEWSKSLLSVFRSVLCLVQMAECLVKMRSHQWVWQVTLFSLLTQFKFCLFVYFLQPLPQWLWFKNCKQLNDRRISLFPFIYSWNKQQLFMHFFHITSKVLVKDNYPVKKRAKQFVLIFVFLFGKTKVNKLVLCNNSFPEVDHVWLSLTAFTDRLYSFSSHHGCLRWWGEALC